MEPAEDIESRRPAATETSPLLGDVASDEAAGGVDVASEERSRTSAFLRSIVCVFVLVIVTNLCGYIAVISELRLLRLAVCRDYYRETDPSVIGEPPQSDVDESLCNNPSISMGFSYLLSTKALLTMLMGLIFTYPYGCLSDRLGRKPVAFLAVLGQVLSVSWVPLVCYFHQIFPTKAVLLSPLFLAIGGGYPVISTMMYSIVVDVSPRSVRSTMFYIIGAFIYILGFFMVRVSTSLYTRLDMWLGFKVIIPILFSSLVVVAIMPETLGRKDATAEDENNNSESSPGAPQLHPGSSSRMNDIWQDFLLLSCLSRMNKMVLLCFPVLFLFHLGTVGSISVYIPYFWMVFDWPADTIRMVMWTQAFVSLCTLVIIAGVDQVFKRHVGAGGFSLDLYVVRGSFVALALGALFLSLGRVPVLFVIGCMLEAAGSAAYRALQGILASVVDGSMIGQVFSAAAVIQIIAQELARIVYPLLLQGGSSASPSWIMGLPFFASMVLYIVGGGLSLCLRTK